MLDLLIYCPNVDELQLEMEALHPEYLNEYAEDIESAFILDKTPPIWKGKAFVCRIRVVDADIVGSLESIEIFYADDEDNLDTLNKAKFDAVNDRTPQVVGGIDYTPPKIGKFL